MARYVIVFTSSFLFYNNASFSQDQPSIQLDRPDQTECPFITSKNYIQFENGFNFERINSTETVYTHPSTLWKFGVTEKFELRLITQFVSQKTNHKTTTGLLPISIGFKTTILEEKGLLPKTSFIGNVTTSNWGSKNFSKDYVAPAFRFAMQHTLSENVSLAYNLGAEWDGENPDQTYIYTLATGVNLTEKLGCYGEVFGFLPKNGKASHSVDAGLTYLINNDLMADISGGFGITDTAPKNYLSLGISYRFNTKKRTLH